MIELADVTVLQLRIGDLSGRSRYVPYIDRTEVLLIWSDDEVGRGLQVGRNAEFRIGDPVALTKQQTWVLASYCLLAVAGIVAFVLGLDWHRHNSLMVSLCASGVKPLDLAAHANYRALCRHANNASNWGAFLTCFGVVGIAYGGLRSRSLLTKRTRTAGSAR